MMNQYTIKQLPLFQNHAANNHAANHLANIDIDWQSISALHINCFPWYQCGKKQKTTVKLCANKEALFLQVVAQDTDKLAKQTELNHMLICEDSCFEFFFSPSGVLGSSYINLEVNCCGTMHIAYGSSREDRLFISRDLANSIICKSSMNNSQKIEQGYAENIDDKSWTIELKLPFSVIKQLTGEAINTRRWLANFYRCGGDLDPQYASWNDIKVTEPDYHQPRFFGEINFA